MKRIIVSLFLVLGIVVLGFGQESQNTKNSADQMLRSNGTVNPSTLGLEMNIPLGSYPGRGINLPLGLSYSSKLWRFEAKKIWLTPSYTNGLSTTGSTWTYVDAQYSENSAAGWSSSIAQPYVEYTGEFTTFNGFGNPGVDYWVPSPKQPPPAFNLRYVIKRITVYLPGGSSYELRDGDEPIPVGQYQNSDGVYSSVDGSGVKYIECPSGSGLAVCQTFGSLPMYRLYMPDGSFYDFRTGAKEDRSTSEARPQIRRATKLTDAHGNYLTFNDPEPNASPAYPYGSITDQLGRKFPVMVPRDNLTASATQSFTLPGMTGAYTLNWQPLDTVFTPGKNYEKKYKGDSSHLSPYATPFYPTLFASHGNNGGCSGDEMLVMSDEAQNGVPILFNPIVLADIKLPNGAKYKFTYNNFGEVEQIIYPTGGHEELFHGQVASLAQLTPAFQLSNRGVIRRDVYESNTASTWIYNAASSTNNYRTTVLAPDGTETDRYMYRGVAPIECEHSAGDFPDNQNGLRWGYDNVLAGRPYDERSYASDGSLTQRTVTRYSTSPSVTNTVMIVNGTKIVQINPRVVTSETITYDGANGLDAATKLIYTNEGNPGSPLNVIRKEEFPYFPVSDGNSYPRVALSPSPVATPPTNPPTLSDPTIGQTPTRITETAYETNSAYLARGFLKLPLSVVVKNSAGDIKAKSEITYDESTYLVSDSASGVPGWSAPEVAGIRGLPTTTKSYYDINNSQFVQTHVQYNQFGSPRKSWDGNWNGSKSWNFSEIQYNDNFSDGDGSRHTFAFPTKNISSPANASDTAFYTETTYRFDTGQVVSTKDINNQETLMSYADAAGTPDPLLRIRKVTAPNGQQTITEYGQPNSTTGIYDSTQRFVKTSTQIDASNWKHAYAGFDGLGRANRTQAVDNTGNGDVFVDTAYDSMGRVLGVTNPYCVISNPRCNATPVWTTNTYDTAGRLWKVTAPDSDPVITTYGIASTGGQIGTVTTVSDQAGKLRRSISNALGHLIRVDEPTASPTASPLGAVDAPTQPTYYEYDTLNNLTKVSQNWTGSSFEQTRTFNYDALSRLQSATNPESGTINYVYDNNGNLTQKTDARNITTTYTYDALNRVIQRSYSGESGYTTPSVSYFYDNLSNAKGKLIKVTNGTGVDRSTTEYTSFDILGRVTGHKQTTDDNQYTTSYTYNLSGGLIEEQYPSGRVVKNVLDNNGDLSMVQSMKTANAGLWNYAQNFSYAASGAVTSMQLGNGTWEKTQFNSRLQPYQIALGKTAGATDLLKLDYTYGGAANNGNIVSQTITVPNSEGQTNGFTAVQNYTYDNLNRIKSATEMIGTQSWKQTFDYDRYGNRRFDLTNGNTTVPAANCETAICNPTISTSNNRLTSGGWQYDAAGNVTSDPQSNSFQYDAENKQVRVENNPGQGLSLNTVGQYFYDGDGKRVKKVVPTSTGTETTIFVYDAAGKLVAEYSTNVLPVEEAEVAYLTNDHLGSPRINTDRDGNVTARHDYHPFGEEIVTTQRTGHSDYTPDSIRKQFTGYERDEENGLDFAQARYYSKIHGRFTTVDPLLNSGSLENPQTLNRYPYVINNPLIFIDPSGTDYQVCYGQGGTAGCFNYTDKMFNKIRKEVEKSGFVYRNGNIRDPDGNWVGSYNYYNNSLTGGSGNLSYTLSSLEGCGSCRDERGPRIHHPVENRNAVASACNMLSPCIGPMAVESSGEKGGAGLVSRLLNKILGRKQPSTLPGLPTTAPIPAGLGNTGRTTAANLTEQLAMTQVRANPAAGRVLPDVPMTDSRWPASAGWVKMAQNINGVEVHYVYNNITKLVDDFKFK